MSDPAYVEPDEHGQFHLLVDGQRKRFRVDHDGQGRPFLCEILPLPTELEAIFEKAHAHPERLIRRRARG